MDVFAALADPTRRAILARLARQGRARVVDLTENAGMSRPAVSKHLRLLAEAGLVDVQDRGRERHYGFRPDGVEPVRRWLDGLSAEAVPQAAVPIPEHLLDGLDLEVRRTVRDHSRPDHHETEETA